MFSYDSGPWEIINRILFNCKEESEHRTVFKLTVGLHHHSLSRYLDRFLQPCSL